VAIKRSSKPVASQRLASLARSLLDASNLCAIATVALGSRAHVNNAYFAWSHDFGIVWLSEPRAKHSRNLRTNKTVAIAVYDSAQQWGSPDRGIQLFGTAKRAEGAEAEAAERHYARRFPAFRDTDLGAYGFYAFLPRRLKLFDEESLGAGTFVSAKLAQSRLVWERTELYRPSS
jgi:uncharacterized protein YhbP (UPF0306 family)